MRGLRRVASAVVLAGVLALPTALSATALPTTAQPDTAGARAALSSGTPSTATPTPGPTQTPPAPALPEEIADWFTTEAPEAVEAAGLGEGADIDVGRPRQVTTWSAAFIAGDAGVGSVETLEEWVAPVLELPEEDDEPAPLGVVRASDADPPELVQVDPDLELAGALADLGPGVTVVFDTAVGGWFALADGEVWPITAEARTVLQGSLEVDVFQSFLSERMGGATGTAEPVEEPLEEESLTPLAAIIVIVVLGAGAAWLLVRQYRRTDSRIAADVHAGVIPPRHEEEPGR